MANKTVIEVRSSSTDGIVLRFEEEEQGVNIFTAGYVNVCKLFGINRVIAEERYYVTEA